MSRPLKIRRAFLMTDMLVGQLVLAILAGVLFVSINRTSLANRRLLDARHATDIAETSLAALQTGQPLERRDDAIRTTITVLGRSTERVEGKWVRVEVTFRNAHADLVGLVPKDAPLPTTSPEDRQ